MIKRYTRKKMEEIWSEQNRYLTWLKVEWAVCEELNRLKIISQKDFKILRTKVMNLIEKGGVDPKRVEFHEAVTKHDVIAFTTAVAERIGKISRYIHYGLTSSDVVDTALSLMTLEAGRLIEEDLKDLQKILKKQAKVYQKLPTIGRTHGIFAEPTSFGLKFLSWYTECSRNLKRLQQAMEGMRVGKLSGAVGVCAHWSPRFESTVLKRLKLKREEVSTQVIPRDRHAEVLTVLALCGGMIERISVELRHLQRSEVKEVMEGFKKGQKGSSAMPHKRNPISSENLTGCARMLRAYSHAAQENLALWHERDISHSSVERIAFSDAFILLDYALARMTGVIENLVVNKEQVQSNLEKAGLAAFSGHYLLALVEKGVTREEAYQWVQSCALKSIDTGENFVECVKAHSKIQLHLGAKKINELGSMSYQLRHVDQIYKLSF